MKNQFKIFDERPLPLEIKDNFRSIDHLRDIRLWTRRKVKVLVLVDSSISTTLGANDFGVGRVIKLLRDSSVGCTDFEVDIALRAAANIPADISFEEIPNPGTTQARYIDFRFDSQVDGQLVLNRYHELFLFGFTPGNDAGLDSRITAHVWHSTDAELQVLSDWMNQGGGVFATGDHDYLGASMCHRIPRVGSMRKWTNADGVPPIGGPTRLDTNMPANADEENGTETISTNNERDEVPQRIDWIPQRVIRQGAFRYKYPHRILCHPKHGPINVMPDHPHEGLCEEPSTINYSANVAFGSEKEYPEFNGIQPKPSIIAYGNVYDRPNQQKGDVNAARFPMISVYDGRSNGSTVGRVVVDSTWHHWFNMNLSGLEAATNQTNWEKISRYFINVALWIAPKNMGSICYWEFVKLHFDYAGLRAINQNTSIYDVGVLVRQELWKRFGKCWTIDFVFQHICHFRPSICEFVKKWELMPERTPWIQPQLDNMEILALGHIYRSVEGIADKLRYSMSTKAKKSGIKISAEQVEEATVAGIKKAMENMDDLLKEDLAEIKRAFGQK